MTNIPVLTVTQLTNAIKLNLEATFPMIWLQGEVSNFKLQTSGHLYFSLKDANAQIAVVMFRTDVAGLKILPKAGDQVIVKGELNVYPPKGNYQIVIRELTFAGVGELLLKLEQLKIKLHKLGWFSSARKKPLPKFPKRIGVVTSPTGAVIQDILNILTRRFSCFHLILNPVKVQGEGAAKEIAQAIEQFNKYDLADVLIVGRGGGSIEDLWAFNEEIVAEAIFNSRIPIISAVGHETDHCIADYVADVRAPTPSAAAEMVIAEKTLQEKHLSQVYTQLLQTFRHQLKHHKSQLQGVLRHPLLTSSYALLGESMQRLDDLRQECDQTILQFLQSKRLHLQSLEKQNQALKPTTRLQFLKQSLTNKQEALHLAWQNKLKMKRQIFNAPLLQKKLDLLMIQSISLRKERLKKMGSALSSIDPKNLLKRGYSILLAEKDGSVITSVQHLIEGDNVRALLSDGTIDTTIKSVKSNRK